MAGATRRADLLRTRKAGSWESRVMCPIFLLLWALTQALGVGGWGHLGWNGVTVCLFNDGVESLEFHGSWVLALLPLGTEPGSLPMCS